ncbi:MAG: peptidoglycan-binding protein [Chthoniobacterales bacterium]|nr:peptidoglycan-binding protein [Chthoniobacterales bacterium]
MKKITSLLIGCSLAVAGVALAQQPDEQPSPNKKKGAADKTHAAEAKPGADAEKSRGAEANQGQKVAKPDGSAAKQQGATTDSPAATEGRESARSRKPAPSGNAKQETSTTTAPAAANAAAAPADKPDGQRQVAGAKKKPDPQQVQKIKQQHANFRAQPRPQQVPPVTFQQNYRIQGADRWQGPQYEVFRSYRPERHDEGWYRSQYSRVELIGGGYYYWNNGYWFPAWGYSPEAEYYAYDAPIYVGQRAEPPDRVIANVQATLQEMGYYKGEVDGLLGPLTREALTGYQANQGLTATAVIDQPTLDSLGMG